MNYLKKIHQKSYFSGDTFYQKIENKNGQILLTQI